MNPRELIDTARTLVACDKGLLAMDEVIQRATNDLPSCGFGRPRRRGGLIMCQRFGEHGMENGHAKKIHCR